MSDEDHTGSVSRWIGELCGDPTEKGVAQQQLWDRYFSRLSSLARSRMPADARVACDEEDVALSALSSFFRRADNGEFPLLTDRTGLWPLLARITVFKAIKRVEHERTQKRGGDPNDPQEALSSRDLPSLDAIVDSEPTPELVAEMLEQVELFLGLLPDPALREIAELKLTGHRNTEIAELKNIGLRSVERKLARIRTLWIDVLQAQA